MTMRYHFRVTPPAQQLKLRILETDRDGPLLAATFNGYRRDLTTAALLRSFFALPLVTFKIVAAIHWEALRLWVKGARLVPRPVAATHPDVNTGLASAERNDYTGRRYLPHGGSPGRASALWSGDGWGRSTHATLGHRAASFDGAGNVCS